MLVRSLSGSGGSGGALHTEAFFRGLSSEYYTPINTKISSDGTFTLCSSYGTSGSVMATIAKKCTVIISEWVGGTQSGTPITSVYDVGDNIIAMGADKKYTVLLIDDQ